MDTTEIIKKEFRLPKAFAEKWLTALRSGKYKQTTSVLYDLEDDGYCCLGVACRMEYPLHYLKNENGGFASVIEKADTELKFELHKIPKELKGNVSNNNLIPELTSLNDEDLASFEEIADWVENNVKFYE
jgi:hypothetical protein